MALGALKTPDADVGFDAQGTALMPITAGTETVGTIELKSPFEMFKDTFTSMKESLLNMVGLQTQEQKDAAFVGPMEPNDDLAGVDTDDNTYGNFVEKAENVSGNILDTIKEAFGNVSFGPKMTAILFAGGLVFFMKYKDRLVKVLTPIVQFVKDMIDTFGPGKVFAAFVAGFVLLKSGLAKKGIMKAGSLILKGIKASAAAIDKQGGLLKSMGNGFEKINRGMTSIVGGAKKTGTFITKNLTKGFDKLGAGVKAMNRGVGGAASKLGGGFMKVFGLIGKGFMLMKVGMMSMLSSIGPMIAPLLPVIAIAAGIAAVLYSLKSGFDTFKESLDQGDSLIVAIIKGVGDAMLTLVTLPIVLIKKLVGFIAGLFGFDSFKEKLEEFDIKEKIVEAFSSLTGGLVKILKAVAAGAGAALASVFKFKNPIKSFSEAYSEVMAGGEGKSEIEKADEAAGIDTGDGSIAETIGKERNEKIKKKANFMNMVTDQMDQDIEDKTYFARDHLRTGEQQDKYLNRKDQSTDMLFEMNKADKLAYDKNFDKTGQPIMINTTNQGDVYNQKSETNVSGELSTDHSDRTARAIEDAMMA